MQTFREGSLNRGALVDSTIQIEGYKLQNAAKASKSLLILGLRDLRVSTLRAASMRSASFCSFAAFDARKSPNALNGAY